MRDFFWFFLSSLPSLFPSCGSEREEWPERSAALQLRFMAIYGDRYVVGFDYVEKNPTPTQANTSQ